MADVVISHSSKTSENLQKVSQLAKWLSPRWNVWWDDGLVGKFPSVIESKIRSAKCVIPIWTQAAHDSEWVQDELALARKCGTQIVPVRLEPCEPPFGYDTYSGVDLTDWGGNPDHPALLQLGRKLAGVVPPVGKPQRPRAIFGERLELPALFMSVSSHETQLKPLDGVRALRLFGAKAVLVSAYDLLPERRPRAMVSELKKIRKAGGLVLVDSGNYEASRRDDTRWNPGQFKRALHGVPHDCVFSFDVMKAPRNPRKAALEIVAAVRRDRRFTAQPVLPIVHLPRSRDGYDAAGIAQVVLCLAQELAPPMIAIPERELGQGLAERAKRVQEIRQELNRLPFYQPLHLLGTGNPWSIAVLAAAGADSFDGLEWCRVAVDREANRLNHFQHFDLFAYYQQGWVESPQVKALVSDENVNFNARVAFHNLDYFFQLGQDLRQASAKGNLEAFVTAILGATYKKFIGKNVPTLFS